MTYREARVYLDNVSKYGSVLGLDTIRNLLGELGNPQDELQFIHIAGTNGKGSVLGFISTILSESGYRVGRYISPTVISYLERIQIDGVWIEEETFAELVEKVQRAVARMETDGKGRPTVFEIETAIAFLYFRDRKCDYVVLETGLGGRLDATNIVKNTVLAVFATISRDHMGFLGDTLEEIAAEKAGIIKPGCTVISAAQAPQVQAVLEQKAAECGCPVFFAKPENVVVSEADYHGMTFSWHSENDVGTDAGETMESIMKRGTISSAGAICKQWRDLQIHLAGKYQIQNVATALEAVQALQGQQMQRGSAGEGCISDEAIRGDETIRGGEAIRSGVRIGCISDEAIRSGLAKTVWPGRFTCIHENPVFIVDGAHNEDAARQLSETLTTYFPGKRFIYIMGVFKDKEYEKIAGIMAPLAKKIYTINLPDANRTLDAQTLKVILDAADSERQQETADAADSERQQETADAAGGNVAPATASKAAGVGLQPHLPQVEAIGDIRRAVEHAMRAARADDVIVAFGSLSYLGQVMEMMKEV